MYFYKATNGHIITPDNTICTRYCSHNTRSSNQITYCQPLAHSNMYHNSFFPSTISLWNSLPQTVVCAQGGTNSQFIVTARVDFRISHKIFSDTIQVPWSPEPPRSSALIGGRGLCDREIERRHVAHTLNFSSLRMPWIFVEECGTKRVSEFDPLHKPTVRRGKIDSQFIVRKFSISHAGGRAVIHIYIVVEWARGHCISTAL